MEECEDERYCELDCESGPMDIVIGGQSTLSYSVSDIESCMYKLVGFSSMGRGQRRPDWRTRRLGEADSEPRLSALNFGGSIVGQAITPPV